ncbi:hypothetical protein PENSPDRAFT_653242 [Peniophora sp. CONT]|nr:hypothetical protein PENSPDRAFT_653242 [Peniophora sp. CONT]
MASSNKKQVRDIYKRIDGLAASLKRGAQDGDPLFPAHQDAIAALAQSVWRPFQCTPMTNIVAQRHRSTEQGHRRHRQRTQESL